MISSLIRSFSALVLLLCFGLSVPAVGGPLHVCLSEWLKTEAEADCCHHCEEEIQHNNPCCIDLEELPDAQVPSENFSVPNIPVTNLDWLASAPHAAELLIFDPSKRQVRIRGPGSPASHRAILEIWRL